MLSVTLETIIRDAQGKVLGIDCWVFPAWCSPPPLYAVLL